MNDGFYFKGKPWRGGMRRIGRRRPCGMEPGGRRLRRIDAGPGFDEAGLGKRPRGVRLGLHAAPNAHDACVVEVKTA